MPRVLTQEDVTDFRERLIDTAERLFAEHGAEAISMRQLATELGVSPMTPYRYFKDKDDILAAVRARGFERFAIALEAALASSDDPIKASRHVGAAYIKFAFDYPAAYRLMFDLSQPHRPDHPDLIRAGTRAQKTMTDHVKRLKDAGLIEGDLDRIALTFWAAIHGLVVLKLSGMLDPSLDFAGLAHDQQLALLRGLRPRSAQ